MIEIVETKEVEICGKKVIIEMKKQKAGNTFYLRPFAKLADSERQSYQYWRQAYSELEKELEQSKERERLLKLELKKQLLASSDNQTKEEQKAK